MKNYYPFFLFALSLLFIQCDETSNTFVTPLRDYEEQRTADNDSIVSFLQSHYYNYDDYANAVSTEHVEFTIDSLTNEPSKIPMIDQVVEQEVKIKDYIMTEVSRVSLNKQIEEMLVPTEKVVQIRKGKKISKEKTYFPGYIMMKADISGEILHVIKSVSNVLGFLGETKGGEPIPLRQSEVNRMLGKVDELAISGEQINIPFTIGESVKVIDGPFNGFTGSIDNVNEEKRKLEVMVKIFGRKTPLELSYMQVEKL
mgnify:CR=1 FL=1